MSIENTFADLTAAVNRLAAALELAIPTTNGAEPKKPAAVSPQSVTDVAPRASKAKASPASAKTAAAPEAEKPEVVVVNAADVKAALLALDEKHGRELAVSALSRFGARKLGEIPADRYAEALALFTKATETGDV